jgi:hypothetical protein
VEIRLAESASRVENTRQEFQSGPRLTRAGLRVVGRFRAAAVDRRRGSSLAPRRGMDDRGFSLIDALVASAILATGISSLAQVFVIASRTALVAAQATTATTLAAQKVEELRALPWGAARGGEDRIAEYTRRWTVAPLAAHASDAIVIHVGVTPGGAHVATLRARRTP